MMRRSREPRWSPRRARRLLAAGVVLVTAAVGRLWACDVPVFRYALQYWEPDRFVVEITGYDATRIEQRRAIEMLQEASRGRPAINIDLRVVSRDDGSGEARAGMRLRAPPQASGRSTPGDGEILWQAPLNETSAARLIDSPRRREIVRRLEAGETAVWMLLECGRRERDDAAAALLAAELARLQATLELPPRATAALAGAGPITPPLKIAFSTLRVKRDETEETPFVAALLGGEALWQAIDEPIAVPLFGRARHLELLRGDAISAARLRRSCQFLVGPCACEAKRLNPGFDLPVRADWEAGVSGNLIEVIDLDDLSGIGTLARAADEAPGAGGDGAGRIGAGADRARPAPGGERMRAMPAATTPPPQAPPPRAPPPPQVPGPKSEAPLPLTTLVATLAALALVVGAATAWILRRNG